MQTLLAVTVSPRGSKSWSRRALDLFIEQYRAKFPEARVLYRDTYEIPHLSFEGVRAGRKAPDVHSPEEQEAMKLQDELVDELVHATHVVIASPMYNWSAPSALKAWVDQIVNLRTNFTTPAVLEATDVSIIISSGGMYAEGDNAHLDSFRPWIKNLFMRFGHTDVHFINVEPTGPMDQGGLDENDPTSAWTKAQAQIAERIAILHQ